MMFVNDESDKALESEKGMRRVAEIKPSVAGQKGEKVMNDIIPIPSQESIFRMDAIALARDACPKLTHGEWHVVLNALNSQRCALFLARCGPIWDALYNTMPEVVESARIVAGTHPAFRNKSPFSDMDGSAASLICKYPAWTDTQWRAMSLLVQACCYFGLQVDELPFASE